MIHQFRASKHHHGMTSSTTFLESKAILTRFAFDMYIAADTFCNKTGFFFYKFAIIRDEVIIRSLNILHINVWGELSHNSIELLINCCYLKVMNYLF